MQLLAATLTLDVTEMLNKQKSRMSIPYSQKLRLVIYYFLFATQVARKR